MRAALDTIGVLLVDLGAMGVVGVDLVHQASRTWLIEVNPRYPASAEVIETERQQSIIDWHVATCRGEPRPATRAASAQNVAKLIVFADQPHTASPAFVDWCMSHCLAAGGPLADVPRRHTRFSPGDPLVSVIATDQYAPLAVARDWCRRVRCQLAAVDSLD
jgi:predicted ATP-grasp superfamily ATP-dependent carboligase